MRVRRGRASCFLSMLIAVATLYTSGAFSVQPTAAAASPAWTTYLYDNGRSGFNGSETIITPSSAPNLKLDWTTSSSGCTSSPGGPISISAQPIVSLGMQRVFWGSWDGCEHATDLNGNSVWSTYIGQTSSSACNPPTIGAASTGTLVTESIGGVSTPVYLLGGGDGAFYALNAATGKVIWRTSLSTGTGSFVWSSPAVYNGSVYEGVASVCDVPLVRGALVQLSATSGAIQHVFYVVPSGCSGGSIWASPTVDMGLGTIYVATGNHGSCSRSEPYAVAVLALRASNLSLLSYWQIPASEQVSDSDFGATPTLFQATINGMAVSLLGLANKNGRYYAFNRNSIGSGPIWQDQLWRGGSSPQGGQGSISPSAFDGARLYVAGGSATINGVACKGSVFALRPATGARLWGVCLSSGPVIGAVTAVPGVIEVGDGQDLRVLGASSGNTLFDFTDTSASGAQLYGPGTISHGMLYQGDMKGRLFAFGT